MNDSYSYCFLTFSCFFMVSTKLFDPWKLELLGSETWERYPFIRLSWRPTWQRLPVDFTGTLDGGTATKMPKAEDETLKFPNLPKSKKGGSVDISRHSEKTLYRLCLFFFVRFVDMAPAALPILLFPIGRCHATASVLAERFLAIAGGCERVEGVQGGGAQRQTPQNLPEKGRALCFGTKISRAGYLGCDSCKEGVEGLSFYL